MINIFDTLRHAGANPEFDEHDLFNGLVQINDTHFVLAFTQEDGGGAVSTFSIDENETISTIDTLTYTDIGRCSTLVKLDSTHLALAYLTALEDTYADARGFIKTLELDFDFHLTVLSTLQIDDELTMDFAMKLLDATHLALFCSWGRTIDEAQVRIFEVDESYVVSQVGLLEVAPEPWPWTVSDILVIDATHLAVSYCIYDAYTYITTILINPDYTMSIIDTLDIGGYNFVAEGKSLLILDTSHILLACGRGLLYIYIFEIDGDYRLSQTSVAVMTGNSISNSLLSVGTNTFLLASGAETLDGHLALFTVDGDYKVDEVESVGHTRAKANPPRNGGSNNNKLAGTPGTHILLASSNENGVFLRPITLDDLLHNISQY